MPLFLLFVAAVLLVATWNNRQGDLFAALAHDVPGYASWMSALATVGALGFIPGMKIPSRMLLALILLVLFMGNYSRALAGIQHATSGAAQGAAQADVPDPASEIAANPAHPTITTANVEGTSGGAASTVTPASAPASPFDPNAFLDAFLAHNGVSVT